MVLQCVSQIWASLTWVKFVICRLEVIFTTAPAASKMTLASKVVKIDSKIIILLRKSKSSTHSVCMLSTTNQYKCRPSFSVLSIVFSGLAVEQVFKI